MGLEGVVSKRRDSRYAGGKRETWVKAKCRPGQGVVGQYIRLVQMTPFIAQDARDLTWTHGVHLHGADSIHVASAIDRQCEELLTTNGRMGRISKHADALARFSLVCRQGRDTQCLPQKYRQQDAFDGKPH